MHPPYHIPLWKQVPVFRLLLPLMAGIILEWYIQCRVETIRIALFLTVVILSAINFLPAVLLFRFKKIRGILFHLLLLAFGMLLTWQKDARHASNWYGNFLNDSSVLEVAINEPLVSKARSFKAEARVLYVINGKSKFKTSGRLLLYFTKDSSTGDLQYADVLLIRNNLQSISNSGNPGAFNYTRYAAFQLLYHQAFLKKEDWVTTDRFSVNYFQYYLFQTRDHILSVLKKYIRNEHRELGIAEALLIGYKEDLDKDLVQAYSNTGVVHIIAISGLHLGLIYAVLIWILERVPWLKKSRHAKAILLITCLWLFSLLTGGSASVLRSAVMFTVIIAGKYYFRRSSVYNSLAASAFILLCYNPYFLWDVGFQLSYCAVIGIVALQQFIFRKWYIRNRVGRELWSMASVTLAAQISAFPLCIYYFHQFPNMFLITNLVAVPLSTVILFGEILLIILAVFETLAGWIGKAISLAIHAMNEVIFFCNSFPFSVWDFIYADVFTTWTLYAFVFFMMAFWMNGGKRSLRLGLCCLLVFTALHTISFIRLQQQKKVVIYNISRHRAVDIIDGNRFVFLGDSILAKDGLQQHFHLKPSRTALQASKEEMDLSSLTAMNGYIRFYNKSLLLIDSSSAINVPAQKIWVDILLFSHNPPVNIEDIIKTVRPACIVFDASNSLWKIQKWKKECEALILRCHSVAEKGAFVLELNSP